MTTLSAPNKLRPSTSRTRSPGPSAAAGDSAMAIDRRAAELVGRLAPADGLRICLALADERAPHFSAAALRCHSRLLAHSPQISVADAQAALAALANLRGTARYAAAETLREICGRCDRDEAARVLDAWLSEPPYSTRSGEATSSHARVELESGG